MNKHVFIAHCGGQEYYSSFYAAERSIFAYLRDWASRFDKKPEYAHVLERMAWVECFLLDQPKSSPVKTAYRGTVKVRKATVELTISRQYTYGKEVSFTETLHKNIPEGDGMVVLI